MLLSVVVGHLSYIGLIVERNKKKELDYLIDKARQEEADRLNVKIMHLDRQRSLGMVAMSFSHELNQPLNGVFLSAEVALRGLKHQKLTADQHLELLERMLVNIQHAKKILHRLGSVMRSNSTAYQIVNLNKVIDNVLYLVRPLTESYAVTIQVSSLPEISVRGDALSLSQAVLNIVRNALEAVQGHESRIIRIALRLVDEEIWLSVEDSGDGFSAQVLKEVGQAMVTTKQEGLGMGLCITQNIVEQHHGRMMYANHRAPAGATVTMILPLVVTETAAMVV
jgi:C4-dicarboxylate-specific signal transduction histidine kinase